MSLQVYLNTKVETAALRQETTVDALCQHIVAHREFRIGTEVFSHREQVVTLSPHGDTLDVSVADGELIAQRHGL